MFSPKVVRLERIAEIVTNSTPVIIGAVLLGSLAVAVLIAWLSDYSTVRVGHHLLRAANYRILRARAFVVWNAETCA